MNKSVEKLSFELHQKAWSDQNNWGKHLESALSITLEAIQTGKANEIVKNNYAAILLDQQKNQKALTFLKENLFEFKECHSNMAIAIAKTDISNIDEIRFYNKSSQNLPSKEYAIEAYIDWQGL